MNSHTRRLKYSFSSPPSDKGFTLIELMVVVAIASILVSMAVPSFTALMKDSRMRSEANGLLGAFVYARTEAVRRGNLVHIGSQGAGGGIVAWVDQTGGTAGTWEAGEELRLWEPINSSMTINSAGSFSSFTFYGNGLANTSDVLTLCDNRTGETGRTLTLLITGLTYLSDTACT